MYGGRIWSVRFLLKKVDQKYSVGDMGYGGKGKKSQRDDREHSFEERWIGLNREVEKKRREWGGIKGKGSEEKHY